MTSRLSQILAVLPDAKNRAKQVTTGVLHQFQRNTAPLNGIKRTYEPKDDDGDRYPSEETLVQVSVTNLLDQVRASLVDLFNLEYTSVTANTKAVATVKVNGRELLTDAPVTYLLFLEKQLKDLHTVVQAVPTLDPADKWHWDDNAVVYATDVTRTSKSKKVPRNHVMAEATSHHPAQVQMYHEDVLAGYWSTVKYSGAIPGQMKVDVLERITTLRSAVKAARSEGNTTVVEQEKALGARVFDYLLEPLS